MARLTILTFILFIISGCSSSTKVIYHQEPPTEFAKLYATGYAPINSQSGRTKTEKLLQAIKASKLDAYKELTAQIHGHQINSKSQFNDLMIKNSSLTASVEGLVRGARVIKSYPVNDDIYVTELELDYKDVYLLHTSNTSPRHIINE